MNEEDYRLASLGDADAQVRVAFEKVFVVKYTCSNLAIYGEDRL